MAIDTPPHIHGLFKGGYCLLAHITMAGFARNAFSDVRPVVEMNKIRYLVNRDPFDRFVVSGVIVEFL